MRTTLALDDDVLAAARDIAAARSESLGAVISDLVRRGLKPAAGSRVETADDGIPVIRASGSMTITSEDVARALDDE